MSEAPRTYCASVAQAQQEPLLGTAPRVDVWLLLEYQPVWEAKALQFNDLPQDTLAWLDNLVRRYADQGQVARPQFIRQRRGSGPGITFLVGTSTALQRFDVADYPALTQIDPIAEAGTPVGAPQYFVCSNGRRDLCCSRFGLPVYARLRDLVADRAWEISHVGGHRFAANVLALPQNAMYGHLAPEHVGTLVADIEADKLCQPFLRGRCNYPPVAQVAETRLPFVQQLLRWDEQSATFATAEGEQTVQVRRASEAIRIVPSCGAEEEEIYPFLID